MHESDIYAIIIPFGRLLRGELSYSCDAIVVCV